MTTFLNSVSNRRTFLKRLAASGAVTIVGASYDLFSRPMTALAAAGANNDTVIVQLFLRGGSDGVNIIVPHGDDVYYNERPALALHADRYDDLDGFFGLNKDFAQLYSHFDAGRLGIVNACGPPQVNLSHFQSQPLVDRGLGSDGWLQRVLQATADPSDSGLRGISISERLAPSLAGPIPTAVVDSVSATIDQGTALAVSRPALEAMYAAAAHDLEKDAVAAAVTSFDQFSMVMTGTNANYPSTNVARQFAEAAALIKADIGVRAVNIDFGGWDTHDGLHSRFATHGPAVAGALDSFHTDLGTASSRVVVVVVSEFGRNVFTRDTSGDGGSEHGHGNMVMVMGDALVDNGGGQVHYSGEWPDITFRMPVTTDIRTVFAELTDRHIGADPSAVFPGHNDPYVGLLGPSALATELGDTDQSGTVDAADAELIVNDIVGNPTAGYMAPAGDLDADGDTDLLDALRLAQQINPFE